VGYRVQYTTYLSDFGVSTEGFDVSPKVDAEFDEIYTWSLLEYVHDTEKEPQGPSNSFHCYLQYPESEGDQWNTEMSMYNYNLHNNPWEGTLVTMDRTRIETRKSQSGEGEYYELPRQAKFVLEWDGQPADEILMEVVSGGRD
jgi:hypothetical protein